MKLRGYKFVVSGLPPKKSGAKSMWADEREAEKIKALRIAAAEAFGEEPRKVR